MGTEVIQASFPTLKTSCLMVWPFLSMATSVVMCLRGQWHQTEEFGSRDTLRRRATQEILWPLSDFGKTERKQKIMLRNWDVAVACYIVSTKKNFFLSMCQAQWKLKMHGTDLSNPQSRMETLISEDGPMRTHVPGGRASGKLSPLRIGRQTTSLLKCISGGRFLRLSTFDTLGHLGTLGVGDSSLSCVLQGFWQYPSSLPIRCPSTCYSVVTTKYIPRHWQMSPRRPNFPWLRTSALGKEVGKQKVSSSVSYCMWLCLRRCYRKLVSLGGK